MYSSKENEEIALKLEWVCLVAQNRIHLTITQYQCRRKAIKKTKTNGNKIAATSHEETTRKYHMGEDVFTKV